MDFMPDLLNKPFLLCTKKMGIVIEKTLVRKKLTNVDIVSRCESGLEITILGVREQNVTFP
jgi:hypothetical protein